MMDIKHFLVVLLPYEITLFSNIQEEYSQLARVLLPYEITLFSNGSAYTIADTVVLLPYEITLFSNYLFGTSI